MQVKCPHCRYKYNEMLKPGMTELVSICPRCGQSFSVEVTDEDILKEQTPPPAPQTSVQQPAPAPTSVPPVVPQTTPAPAEVPVQPPVVPSAPVQSQPVTNWQDYKTQRSPYASSANRYNYSPAKSGSRLKVLVLFFVAAAITAGVIFLLTMAFGKDEAEPVETVAASASTSEMSSSEMGNFSYSFEGSIKGEKKTLPIKMKITKTATIVEGSYYYVNQNPRMTLELKGKVADDGTITMREYNDGEEDSGSFEGAIDTNGNFNGIFRYMKNKYKFEMKRVKSTTEQ